MDYSGTFQHQPGAQPKDFRRIYKQHEDFLCEQAN